MDEVHTAPQPFVPAPMPNPVNPQAPTPPIVKAEEPKIAKVDHLVEIAELARSLHNVSPSGAETVSAKILEHIGAIQDPKAHEEKLAREKKASDDAEAERKKVRDANKAKVA